jgi:hypothetical protein
MRKYKVGLGIESVALKYIIVEAKNKHETRSKAISTLTPDMGYDHIEVNRIAPTSAPDQRRRAPSSLAITEPFAGSARS